MTKKEKQRQWINGHIGKRIEIIANFTHCSISELDDLLSGCYDISGVNVDGELIPMPQFENDKPGPVDKALQEYLKYNEDCICAKPLKELDSRLKALEAKLG